MNWLDYGIIIIIGLGALHGLSHGLLRMATSLLSFALGIYCASIWHAQVGVLAQSHLGTSPAASDIIGYVAIFLLIFVGVEIVGQRIIALSRLVNLNLLDRVVGAVFGAVLATIFAGFDIVILTTFLPANYPLLQDSELAPQVLSYDRSLLEYVPPQIKQMYEEKREKLIHYWNAEHKNAIAPPVAAQ